MIKLLKDQMKWPLFSKKRIKRKRIQNGKKLQYSMLQFRNKRLDSLQVIYSKTKTIKSVAKCDDTEFITLYIKHIASYLDLMVLFIIQQ